MLEFNKYTITDGKVLFINFMQKISKIKLVKEI